MAKRSGSSPISSTFELQLIITVLTFIIKIGRYLPYIAFTFASVNLTLAILDFAIWGNLVFGVLNTMLAIGGFVLTGQLLQRRIINRPEYFSEPRQRTVTHRAKKVHASMNPTSINERELRGQEAA